MQGASDLVITDEMTDYEIGLKKAYFEATKIDVEQIKDSHYIIFSNLKYDDEFNRLYLEVRGLADYNDIDYVYITVNKTKIYQYVLTDYDNKTNDDNLNTRAEYAICKLIHKMDNSEKKHDEIVINDGQARVIVVDEDGNESNSTPLMLFDLDDSSRLDRLSITGDYPGFELKALEP